MKRLPRSPDRETLLAELCRGKPSIADDVTSLGIVRMFSSSDDYFLYNEKIHDIDLVKLIWIFTQRHSYIQGPFDRFYTHNPMNISEHVISTATRSRRFRALQYTNGLVLIQFEATRESEEDQWNFAEDVVLGLYVDHDTMITHKYKVPPPL